MNTSTNKIKKILSCTGNIFSTVILVLAVVLCAYVLFVNYTTGKSGEEPFYFGYRPCLIQTGSMEPYMMTNGIILTKEVNSIDDIQVNDVVTYTATTDSGKKIYITHRIIDITEDGLIYTKGDNNRVSDGFALTIDNIVAKEVGVFNQPSVWLINTWESGTSGKLMLVFGVLAIILFIFAISSLVSGWLNQDEIDSGTVSEYTKLCRKLGLSPADTLQNDIARLRSLLDAEEAVSVSPETETDGVNNG